MIDRLRTAGTVCLAGIAIAGLLSMHGLEAPIGLSTAAPHHSTDQAAPNHGVMGLCLFVVGLVGAGLAAHGLSGRRPAPAAGAAPFRAARAKPLPQVAAVRLRSIELCVLRV